MNKLTNAQYWENYWKKSREDSEEFLFADIVQKNIPKPHPKDDKMTYMEVGGAPGNIMVWFAQTYNCDVSCIDFVAKDVIEEKMKKAGIHAFEVINEDFTEYQSDKLYDIVASYGFVEHFIDYEDIIARHVKMAKENGYVIISMPNIQKMNWLLYRLFNKKSLDGVNTKAIDLDNLRRILKKNGCRIIVSRYWLTNFFMFNRDYPLLRKHKVIQKVFYAIQKIMICLHLDNIPSKFFSPYMICIARKKR